MTDAERADWRRRELLRDTRMEAFAQRAIEANRRAFERTTRLLNERAQRRNRQLDLEYSI